MAGRMLCPPRRDRCVSAVPDIGDGRCRSRAAGGQRDLGERSGGGTVRIAAYASNMAPSRQRTAIPPHDSSMELTAVQIVYDEHTADLSACVCERLEVQE
jgi:hypothetical protein